MLTLPQRGYYLSLSIYYRQDIFKFQQSHAMLFGPEICAGIVLSTLQSNALLLLADKVLSAATEFRHSGNDNNTCRLICSRQSNSPETLSRIAVYADMHMDCCI